MKALKKYVHNINQMDTHIMFTLPIVSLSINGIIYGATHLDKELKTKRDKKIMAFHTYIIASNVAIIGNAIYNVLNHETYS